MSAAAATVEDYMAGLPADRRKEIAQVREVLLANLPAGYEEGIQYGMIGYYVPHSIHPAGYHCNPKQPLPFAALGAQKNHMSLHLMCVYGNDAEFRQEWEKTGKRLDMGKACIRFEKADDLALDVIGATIARFPVAKWIECMDPVKARARR